MHSSSPPTPLQNVPTLNSSACRPLTPTSVLYCGKWRLLSLIPPPHHPAFSLSSVHSLPPLSTYLVPTEQCRRRRALKDRLDCLGILISLFFLFHILGLMRYCVAYSCPCDVGHPGSSRKIVCFVPLGRKQSARTISFVPLCAWKTENC